MTIAELIAHLSTFPPDLPVEMYDSEYDVNGPIEAKDVSITDEVDWRCPVRHSVAPHYSGCRKTEYRALTFH